jgi:hypothetical protein
MKNSNKLKTGRPKKAKKRRIDVTHIVCGAKIVSFFVTSYFGG